MKTLLAFTAGVLLILGISACTNLTSKLDPYILSPSVEYINISDKIIYHIKGEWAGQQLMPKRKLWPGGGPSQNFWFDKKSDVYRDLNISWEDEKGGVFTKRIINSAD